MKYPWPSKAEHTMWLQEQRSAVHLGVAGTVLGALALGAWAALAPLSAAVMAEGTVKSLGNRKTVLHAEGGIVSSVCRHTGTDQHEFRTSVTTFVPKSCLDSLMESLILAQDERWRRA